MKKIKYSCLKNHWLCEDFSRSTSDDIEMPYGLRKFLNRWCPSDASHVVIAYVDKVIIGVARFDNDSWDWYPGTYACAKGTWVDPKYRRQGIATQMWRLGMKKVDKQIHVMTVSRAGGAFARKMNKNYDMEIDDVSR